jgi:glycosyltransferase involved in cell wall biosynthesis
MKVLIISNAFPNSAEKTRGIFTYQIVTALKKKCHVRVIAPLPWFPRVLARTFAPKYSHAQVPLHENIGGIEVYHPRYLVIPKLVGFMHTVFMFFPLLRLINKLENEKKIDLINAHWIFPDGVAATWIARRLRKPIVLTALGCDINLYSAMIFRKFQIAGALKRTDYITAVSNNLKDVIYSLRTPKKSVDVIPNGVDLSLFSIINKLDARKEVGISQKQSLILTVGSLDEVKGTKFLIEALGTMKKNNNSSLPLLISIGDGPLKLSLRSLAEELGIADHVRFLGKRPHKEIPLWMNAANLFCLPSLREGHPNVVIEAFACGVPVVASNVGAIPELINSTNGYVWQNRNPTALALQLEYGLNRNWDRAEIRRNVADYSWENCARRYHDVYSSLLTNQEG